MLTLIAAAALATPIESTPPIEPMVEASPPTTLVSVLPHLLPLGLQGRVHLATGKYTAVQVGVGAAMAVFDTGGETPIRLRAELGADYYFGQRYDSFFAGVRTQVSYWTAPPAVFGGTNGSGGVVLGRRYAIGNDGATVGIAGGALVKKYANFTAFDGSDGIQALPTFEIDFSLPTRRR